MPLFGRPPKQRKRYRILSPEEKLKRTAQRTLAEQIANADDDEKRELVGHILGYKLAPRVKKSTEEQIYEEALMEDLDYREQVKRAKLAELRGSRTDLDEEIDAVAAEQIRTDPVLRAQFVDRRIQEKLGGDVGGPLGEALAQLDAVEEMQDRFRREGGGKSGLAAISSLLSDPKVTAQFLTLLNTLLGARTSVGQEKTYLLQIDGEWRELGEADYRAFVAQQQKAIPPKPIPAVEAPKPLPPSGTESAVPGVGDLAELGQEPPIIPVGAAAKSTPAGVVTAKDAEELVSYIGGPVERFLDVLFERIEKGDQKAILLHTALTTIPLDQLYAKIGQIEDPQWQPFIERLNTPEARKWLEEVVAALKDAEKEE